MLRSTIRTGPARPRPLLLAGLALVCVLVSAGPTTPARAAVTTPGTAFPVPEALRPAVSFWIDIYSRYSSDQTVLHDRERLDVVYAVLDFSELSRRPMSDWERARSRADAEEREKEAVRTLLRNIAVNADRPERLTPEERRIYNLFPPDMARATGAHFLDAAERVRAQVGQRDRFAEGIRISGRYLPEMERIFEEEGVPVELTRLVFVESMFNLYARSAAGASGIWQFIRSTGRRYLRIDELVDERNDPLLAARGAARLLAESYAELGTWPLAVAAYNHGKYGMLRAVSELGTRDIARIVAEYRGPAFGFASRNFYMEFLAALHVERHAERYFGPITLETPYHYDLVAMPGHLTVPELARHAGLALDELRALNPGLTDYALRGRRPMPRGYALRVPADRRPRLVAARLDVRPGWRPPVAVAANQRPPRAGGSRGGQPGGMAAAIGMATARDSARPPGAAAIGPLVAYRTADQVDRLASASPPAGADRSLDHDTYLARLLAADEQQIDLLLAPAVEPGADTDATSAPLWTAAAAGACVPSAASPRGSDSLGSRPDGRVPGAPGEAVSPALHGGEGTATAPQSADAATRSLRDDGKCPAERETGRWAIGLESGTGAGTRARPLEAAGDRLVDAAVEALELDVPALAAGSPVEVAGEPGTAEGTVRPGSRVVPAVAPAGSSGSTFLTAVRGGETVWRLAEWSEEPVEAFRARNRLAPGQSLQAGRPVSISAARVDRETFEARRAAFHAALRERAAREYPVAGTRPHVLAPGETPWRLAEQVYKIPFWLLEQTNPDRDLSSLKAGDTLLVPILNLPAP